MDKEIRQMTMKPLLRSDEAGGGMVVEGYAAVFESPTVLYESEYSGYQYLEQITRGAFDGADMSRTVFKYNHGDNALVLARTSNGSLKLEADEHGLKVTATLAETTAGRDLYTLIRGGYIDKMSFAFTVDATTKAQDDKAKRYLRSIDKIGTVYDVAAVDFPAYDDTEIEARSGSADFFKRLDAKRIEDRKRRLKLLASL
ncbi:MAG: HK97 family phage prohead protease [Veillonellaceae bacterium]|nr:HK97 family phage prohead protease [Veillonellaceae bacterium]